MDSTLYQLLILFLLFYLFLIRPEMKKAKKHQEMLAGLKKGDKILTRGGIYGTIVKVENDNDLSVEVADGVTIVLNKIGVLQPAEVSVRPVAEVNASKKTKK